MNKKYYPKEIPRFIQSCHSIPDGIYEVDQKIKEGYLICPQCDEVLEYRPGRDGYSDYVGCPKRSCNYYISYKQLLGLAKKHCPTCNCANTPVFRKEDIGKGEDEKENEDTGF